MMKTLLSFDDPDSCVSCRKSYTHDSCFIVDKNGQNGPVHSVLSEFLGLKIQTNPRLHGSFLCQKCRNMLMQWKHYCNLAAEYKGRLLENFQGRVYQDGDSIVPRLTPQQIAAVALLDHPYTPKKVCEETATQLPGSPTSPITNDTRTSTTGTHMARPYSNLTPLGISNISNCCGQDYLNRLSNSTSQNRFGVRDSPRRIIYSTLGNRDSRKRLYTFKSVADAKSLGPIVEKVVNGSFGIALSKIYLKRHLRKGLCEAVRKCVKREVNNIIKEPFFRSTGHKDLQNFSYEEAAETLSKRCPMLWACLVGAANDEKCTAKLVACCGILLQQRNHLASRMQCLTGFVLYQSNLKKKFAFLNRIGICASYKSVKQKLNEVETIRLQHAVASENVAEANELETQAQELFIENLQCNPSSTKNMPRNPAYSEIIPCDPSYVEITVQCDSTTSEIEMPSDADQMSVEDPDHGMEDPDLGMEHNYSSFSWRKLPVADEPDDWADFCQFSPTCTETSLDEDRTEVSEEHNYALQRFYPDVPLVVNEQIANLPELNLFAPEVPMI